MAEIVFRSQRDQMATLVRVATNCRTVLASHASFKLMDRSRLRPAHDVQCDGLVSVAAEEPDLEIALAGLERIAQNVRRGSSRYHSLEMHATTIHLVFQIDNGRSVEVPSQALLQNTALAELRLHEGKDVVDRI